jgi:hypothetical protein
MKFGNNSRVSLALAALLLLIILSVYFYSSLWIDSGPDHAEMNVMTYPTFINKLGGPSHMIPKIIWRTSKYPLSTAPAEIEKCLIETAKMNPDYLQIYFDDNDARIFIQNEFPQYLRAYDSLIPGAYKADIFRLLILYKYGGVYNDIGHQYLVPLNDIIDPDDEFIASTEDNAKNSFIHAIHNSFLAVYPRNPLMKALMEMILEDVSTCRYGGDPLDLSGPAAVGHAFNVWKVTNNSTRYGTDMTHYDDPMIRGTYVVNNIKIKLFSHDAQNHYIKKYRDGPEIIKTKFKGYYEMLYPEQKNGRSAYDRQFHDHAVYDLTKTDCSSTGIASRIKR